MEKCGFWTETSYEPLVYVIALLNRQSAENHCFFNEPTVKA